MAATPTFGSWARLSIDLQTAPTDPQAALAGKSIGRLGSPRMDIRGMRPFWVTNSRQWSSIEYRIIDK